jgi:TP901 family phage tail tape measure protein
MTMVDHNINIKMTVDNTGAQQARTELRNVEGAADKATQRVSLIGRAFNNLKTQLLSMNGALASFSAGFAALAAVNTLASFNDQMASVRAVTLATDEEFQKLRDTALQFGATTRFTATQAAEGLELLGRAGATADKAVGLLGTTLQLAQAENLSLAESADFLVKVTTGMRLGLEDTSRVADILSATASKTTTDVRELAVAFRYASGITAGFKTPIEEVAAALGVLAQSGQSASVGGTIIRGFLQRIAAPTKEFEKDLENIGLKIKDIHPETNTLIQIVEKLAAAGLKTGEAFDLFKQRAGGGVGILVDGLPALRQLNSELENVGGTLRRKTDIKADTLKADLLSVLSAVQSLIVALGDAGLERVLRIMAQTFAAAFRGLADALRFIVPLVTNIGAVFLVVFSPVILAAFIAGMVRLVPLFAALAVNVGRAAVAMALLAAANPITALIVIVGTAITVFQQWGDQIGVIGTNAATLADLWQAAMQRVSGYITDLKSVAAPTFEEIQRIGGAAADYIAEKFSGLLNFFKNFFGALGDGLKAVGGAIGQATGLAGAGDSINRLLGEADAIANEDRIGAELRATRGIELQNAAKQKLTTSTRELASAEANEASTAHELTTARQELLSAINGPAATALSNIAALNKLFEDGSINASEYANQLQRLRGQLLQNDQTPFAGMLKGLNAVAEGATKIGDHIATTIQNAFASASSAIADFATSGKFDFKSLTDSILKDLVRLATNQLFGQLAGGLLGGIGGGAVGGAGLLSGLFGAATGASLMVRGNGGTDSQPIAFKASPGERVDILTPQQQKRQGGGGSQTIVNVINNGGGDVQQQRRRDAGGNDIIDIIISTVNKGMAGGKFDQSMRGRYGNANTLVKR